MGATSMPTPVAFRMALRMAGAPAIRNAILNATGVGIDVAPITPHVLFAAFEKAGLFEKEETAHV